jgi:acylphosphatase
MELDLPEYKRLEARVVGRVQGVGYRAFVVRNARALGLGGYVRNNRDGSVDVSAVGRTESLRRLCELLEQGPRGSHVTAVDATWSEGGVSGEDGFRVVR